MRKKMWYILSMLLCVFLLTACGKNREPKPGEEYVYYLNSNGTNLIKQVYSWSCGDAQEEVENILDALKNPEKSVDFKSAIPADVDVEDYLLKDGKLDLYFNEAYSKMTKTEEVLCRAAVVQSLTQIKSVNLVEFYVGDAPLVKADGTEVGYMREEDFLQNTGVTLHSYQEATLKLYFANENGDKLVSETVDVRYNSNMSIEKVIVEQLIKGPNSADMKATIPAETKLLGISVRDGICYVNFNEGFLTAYYGVDPNVALSSLANSIIEGGTANQVQISVNGETNVKFQDVVDLSKPIERNLEIVEENN